ncbi:hypothetical protein B0A53_05406 [Rhodotorula sp. CCFEE 5036]|nr:hypothetical protein B0A53_05406 [Rhodotorula sp. CCFEE 5036]
MVARARTGRKSLKRELAAIKAEEQRASTWLVRISLFLLVLGWAYSEYASNTSATPRTRTAGASARKKQGAAAGTAFDLKPILLATGAALGGVRLLLRFYFMRRAKGIEETLLSDGGAEGEDEPTEPDYDSYLGKLQTQIAARQARLQQIRLRERRANALFITYGLGLWILYTLLWWFGMHAGSSYASWETKALRMAPVVLSPVAIICTRRVSRFYFRTRQEKEEKTLKHLVKQKQDKVEEIKKKTGYYSTRDLLEKYDEALRKGAPGSAPSTPVKGAATPAGTKNAGATPGTPIRTTAGAPATPMTPQAQARNAPNPATAPSTPIHPNLAAGGGASAPGALAAFPTMPPPTPHTRSIMDKVADALLGVSPEETNPYNKYALICAKCFSHNGLCPKDEFDFVQYRCPRCGFFNPRRRDPPTAGSQTGPRAIPLLDTSRHRRVHSEFAPSPLGAGASFARGLQDESSPTPDESTEMEEVPPRRSLPVGSAVAGRVGTSALAATAKGEAVRRRSRKAAGSEDEADETGGKAEEDPMDMDD